MPYVSRAQERYFNANRGKLETQGVNVDEWNAASKGMSLPKRASTKITTPGGMMNRLFRVSRRTK